MIEIPERERKSRVGREASWVRSRLVSSMEVMRVSEIFEGSEECNTYFVNERLKHRETSHQSCLITGIRTESISYLTPIGEDSLHELQTRRRSTELTGHCPRVSVYILPWLSHLARRTDWTPKRNTNTVRISSLSFPSSTHEKAASKRTE